MGGGSTFEITVVQLARLFALRAYKHAHALTPAPKANIFRYLHLYLLDTPMKALSAAGD